MRAGTVRAALLAAACLAPSPAPLAAQGARARPPQLELRADAILGRATTGHLGIGGNVALGNYLRAGLALAGGATRIPGGEVAASGRADLVARFLLDPFREHRWGPYAGAGVGVLWDERQRTREAVLIVLGVEGSAAGSVRPALEAGFGGGTRVGVVLRWGRRAAR